MAAEIIFLKPLVGARVPVFGIPLFHAGRALVGCDIFHLSDRAKAARIKKCNNLQLKIADCLSSFVRISNSSLVVILEYIRSIFNTTFHRI